MLAENIDTYVVDGSNLSWWQAQVFSGQMSIIPLLNVLSAILAHEQNFICVFDASITYALNENNLQKEAKIIEELIKLDPNRFYRVTGSTRADSVILHNADHYNRTIISNDKYSEYRLEYNWLGEKYTNRLIQGNLQPGGLLTLEKLPYGKIIINNDLQLAYSELNSLLEQRNSPELAELNRKIMEKKLQIYDLDKDINEKTSELAKLKVEVKANSEMLARLKVEITKNNSTRNSFVDNKPSPSLKEVKKYHASKNPDSKISMWDDHYVICQKCGCEYLSQYNHKCNR